MSCLLQRMEIIPLRTGLSLRHFVILFWTFHLSAEQGNLPDYNDNKNVIDLLKALDINNSIKGITKAQGSKDGFQVWKFHQKLPDLTLPQDVSTFLVDNIRGSLGFHFVAQQAKHTTGTLITLTSPAIMKGASWPLLSVVSSRTSDQLRLHYRALPDMKPAYILFPDGTPFSSSHWAQLALSVEINKVIIFVDCREAIMLDKNPLLSLDLPADLQVTFGSTPGDQSSKFVGYWQTAKISTVGYQKRPWVCPDAGPQQLTHLKNKAGLSTEGNHHGLLEMKLQSDSPYGQVLERSRPTCTWEGRKVEDGTRWDMEQQASCVCMNGTITCTPTGACSYEGTRYNNGEPFSPDTCSSCICENRCIQCHKVICPPQSCPNQYIPPGQCCPTCYPGCEYEETIYKNGDVFLSRSNPCMNCSCTDSVVRCIPVRCPPTKCHNPIQRPGECCLTCSECIVDGQKYEEGSVWVPESQPCHTCACVHGKVQCRTSTCPPVQCQNPCRAHDGCCLTCDCGKQHNHSNENIFLKPDDPCQTCISQAGTPQCASRDSRPRPTTCPPPGNPNPSACCYKQHSYSNGQRFVDPDDSCKTCICQAGSVQCNPRECEPIACPTPCPNPCPPPRNPNPSACCYKQHSYSNGQRFVDPDDSCKTCICQAGSVQCNPRECEPIACPNPCPPPRNPNPSACCYKQHSYSNGQRFVDPDDSCKTCICQAGSVQCNPRECEPIACPNPCPPPRNPNPSACCYKQHSYSNGQRFVDPDDSCKTCICQAGSVQCNPRECEPIACPNPCPPPRNPNPSACCYKQHSYSNGQRFVDPDDSCKTCICQAGSVQCNPRECEPIACPNPCPPPRNPNPSACCYKQHSYSNGQRFVDPDDSCKTCICQAGSVQCNPRECEPIACPNPCPPPRNPNPSACCYKQHSYSNGQRFVDPDDSCKTCICQAGSVQCNPRECEPIACPTPCPNPCPPPRNPNPSACCYKQHSYSNGQRFVDPDDSCKTCICQAGSVQCNPRECEPIPCPNPCPPPRNPNPSACCYKQHSYSNGQRFVDPDDSCKTCICQAGSVQCNPRECEPIACPTPCPNPCPPPRNPNPSACCYKEHSYSNGQRFVDPNDSRKTCICQAGTVQCTPTDCTHMPCPNPPTLPDDDCSTPDIVCGYKNLVYNNGDTFMDPENPCKICSCLDGRVLCALPSCPPVSCRNPYRPPGQCCPKCSGCLMDGEWHKEGSVWLKKGQPRVCCICMNGESYCDSQHCPFSTIKNPCRGNDFSFENHVASDGEEFRSPSNSCQKCLRLRGEVICQDKECPPPNCSNPRPGPCCRNDCNGCSYAGVEYRNGMQFSHPMDDCRTCRCDNGNVRCLTKRCPPLKCSERYVVPGKCCPKCAGCLFYNMTLAIQQSVRDPRNPCSECTCRDGHVLCTPVECPQVQCQSPITLPGECCPDCSRGCHFQGQVYKNGAAFQMPTKRHVQCSCLNGSVSCHRKQLTSTRSCSYMGAVYADRQIFRIRAPATSSCRDCSCLAGRVFCVDIPCPRLTCKDQVKDPGSCCPRCQDVYHRDVI